MKKKIIFIVVPLILIIGFGAFLIIPKNKDYKTELQFGKIERGDLKTSVSCTGTINAKGTVEVGTQVSGTVSKVYADFNDSVKKDQILAKIDTTLLEIAVSQAEADLVKSNSQYEHDLKNYENNLALQKQKMVSDYDLEAAKVTRDSSYTAKLTAETNLKKAKSNLSYALIKSPINGTVIDRDIDEGQTIQASYSSPTLFKIAEDLSNMQINALVDENDIGKIKLKQKVTFTVEAYPDEEFSGTVNQIRLEPTTVSNVVNYYVIIDAKNPKHHLLPGMTATIDIVVQEKTNILLVQNSALKFKPTQSMFKDMKNSFDKDMKKGNMPKPKDGKMPSPPKDGFKPDKTVSQIWYLDKDKNLKFIFVKTGLTDGSKTEVIAMKDAVEEGLSVITGSSSTGSSTGTTKSQTNKNMMGGGPGAGGPPMF
jgi:HlyD family secretion protein